MAAIYMPDIMERLGPIIIDFSRAGTTIHHISSVQRRIAFDARRTYSPPDGHDRLRHLLQYSGVSDLTAHRRHL